MRIRVSDVFKGAAKCLSAQVILLILAACGGNSDSEKIASQPSLRESSSGLPIATNTYLSTLAQVELAEVDSADASLEFVSAQGSSQPLISDQSAPGRYRLPIVVLPTSGYLNVSMPGRALLSLPVNLVPYQTSDIPGEAVQSFLQSSLRTMNTAVDELAVTAFPLPAVMEATSAAAEMSGRLLTWVNEAMQKGSATMVRLQDGTSMKLTVEDLKVLDQLVLAPAMFSVGGAKQKLAGHSSPVERLFDLLIPAALAETSVCQPDRMRPDPGLTAKYYTPSDMAWCLAMVQPTSRVAFANRAAAAGEALGLAVDMTWHIGRDGSRAYRPGADARAASLAMVGLYTAHYGNALARMLALKDVAISDGEELEVQEALRLLYKGVINQIQATELNLDAWAKDDTTAALIKRTDTAIDKASVENAITQILDIFEARAAGISLCPDEKTAVPSSQNAIVTCAIQ